MPLLMHPLGLGWCCCCFSLPVQVERGFRGCNLWRGLPTGMHATRGSNVHHALKAINQQAVIKREAEGSLRFGLFMLFIFSIVCCSYYTDILSWLGIKATAAWILRRPIIGLSDSEVNALLGPSPVYNALAVGILAVTVASLGIAAYDFSAPATSLNHLDLSDEQRRLLGLEPLRRKPFVPLLVNKPPPRFEAPPSSLAPPSTPGGPDHAVRSPWSDLTPVGPVLGLMDPITRMDRAAGGGGGGGVGLLGSSGRRRPPARSSSRPISFGGSADKKMRDLLEDYQNDLRSPPSETQGYQLPSISPSIGKVGPYRESPVGVRFPGGTHGSSPTVQLDRNEWIGVLTRLGLTEAQLDHYTDNLRELLATEIKVVLARYEQALLALEQYVPREILVRSNRMYEDLLPQVMDQQGYMARIREYRAAARVIEEGYNWKDSYNYVIGRLASLAQGSYLSNYDWNTGGTLHDKNVTVQTPTDPDIVMHIFLVRLDSLAEHRNYEGDQPFIKQHFLQILPDEESPSLRGRNLILRQAGSPPHFDVVEHGLLHRIQHSNKNAFHTMVIFLYLARKHRWLPLHNEGYKRIMQSVFGAVYHPPTPPPATASGGGAAGAPQVRRISF